MTADEVSSRHGRLSLISTIFGSPGDVCAVFCALRHEPQIGIVPETRAI